MFDFTNPMVLVVGIVFVVLGVIVFKLDTRMEGAKRTAIEYRDWCTKMGLDFTAEFLTAFAVGDKSGMISGMRQGIAAMRDEDQRIAVVRKVAHASMQILYEWSPETKRFIDETYEKLRKTEEVSSSS